MSIQSRTLNRPFSVIRALRHAAYVLASALELPIVVGLYLVMVFAGFSLAIGVIDTFALGTEGGSVWPELETAAAVIPGGIFMLPLVVIALAYSATWLLDRAIDALEPA